jgi:uncharacterized protein YndB with AHSA1/START domain
VIRKRPRGAENQSLLENDLPDSAERVWRALTDARLLEEWLMPNNIRAEVGARFQFRSAPVPGWSGIVEYEVLEVVPHRLLVYPWRGGSRVTEGYGRQLDIVVTWKLTPLENGGTRLYLEHSGFDPDSFAFKGEDVRENPRGSGCAERRRIIPREVKETTTD